MREVGYIKLFRQLVSWEWYSDINVTRLFIHLLLTVCKDDYAYQGMTIPRGGIVTTYDKLAAETGLKPAQIRGAMDKLKSTGEITTERVRNQQLVKVHGYEVFQDWESFEKSGKPQATAQAEHRQSTGEPQSIEQEDKNIRNKERDIKEKIYKKEKPVIQIVLNDGSYHPVYQQEIDRWSELYPAVDILQDLRAIAGWNEANPTKRKTKRGIDRHINSWLSRTQDRGGNRGAGSYSEDFQQNARGSQSGSGEKEQIQYGHVF